MPSLRQLLDRHATLLVIDACSPRVEGSLWRDGTARTAVLDGEASAALPVVVARVLAKAGERIVINGLHRVRPGTLLAPQPVAMDAKPELQVQRKGAAQS